MSSAPEFLHPVDPSNGEALAPVACTTPEELAAIVAAARGAASAWADTPFAERCGRLRAFAAALNGAASEGLAQEVSREMGKPLREARAEVRGVASRVEAFIARAEINNSGTKYSLAS